MNGNDGGVIYHRLITIFIVLVQFYCNVSFRSSWSSLLYLLLLGIMALIASSVVSYLAYQYEPLILSFGWLHWLLFFVIVSFTMAFALTPTTFVALLSGYFLGWNALIPMSIAYVAASYIGYQAASRIDQGKFLSGIYKNPKMAQAIERLRSGQLKVIILSRLSPVLPFAVMNVVLAMLKVDLRKLIWGGLAGMLPRTALAVFAGSQGRNIRQLLENPNQNSLIQAGLIGLTVVSIGGLVYVILRIVRGKAG